MKRAATIALLGALALTSCADPVQQIQQRADVVKACKASGGDWYDVPGWGESCHYDTRGKK